MADGGWFGWGCFGKTSGVINCLVLIIGGAITIISFSSICWIVGIYMVCVGVVVGALETPMLCQMFDVGKPLAKYSGAVTPPWRAILYPCLSVFCFWCKGVSSILAALLLFFSGFSYFMVWLGPPTIRTALATKRQELSDRINDQDEESLLGSPPEFAEEPQESAAPWQGFINSVTQQAGKAVAAAAVDQMKQGMNST
eukprot:m.161967 g.161967  ORF g.161967 m.161967 type:complete len:198 (+) comp14369_c0_seq2:303-896(+)